MRVFDARMLDTGTYRRNTVVRTDSGELDGDGKFSEMITTTWLPWKSTLTKMMLIPNAPDWALQPTKVVCRLSGFHEAYRRLSRRKESRQSIIGRIGRVPIRPAVIIRRFQPAWLQRSGQGMRLPIFHQKQSFTLLFDYL